MLWGCTVAPPETVPYRLQVTAEPFGYQVYTDGQPLVATALQETSSLYFVTEAGPQYLTEALAFDTTAHTLTATYATTDERQAQVAIQPQAHGGLHVSVAFEPDLGVLGVGEVLHAQPDEHFHGLTVRATGNNDWDARNPDTPVRLDRRGERVELVARGTLALQSPFYLTNTGYGLLVDGTWTGFFDMAAADTEQVRFQFDGPSLSYQIFPGGTPERIMEQYTAVIGRTLVPHKWVFGPWRWRDNHTHRDTLYDGTAYRGPINTMVYEDLAMMEALDLPMSVYFVDRPWAEGSFGYENFAWDRERLPNPEGMVRLFEEHGIKFLLWIGPWVMGDMAEEALASHYFLPSQQMVALGIKRASDVADEALLRSLKPKLRTTLDQLADWELRRAIAMYAAPTLPASATLEEGRTHLHERIAAAETPEALRHLLPLGDWGRVLIDFTNPDAVAWWHTYLDQVLRVGVDGFKLDRSEEIVPGARDAFAYDGRSLAELRNVYPMLYTKATYEAAQRWHGDDFVLLPRAGFPGSQRYAVFWLGDSHNTWLGLRNAVIGGQRAALIGYPLLGSDTGGYFAPTERELLARWLGFSAFSTIMQVGPTSDRAPWDMADAPHYDRELLATWRLYSQLRVHMQDYTYRHVQAAHDTGHPVMRPLFFDYPDDTEAWQRWDQYLYGDDFLVAPVLEAGTTERSVYLPAGTWIDYWDQEQRYEGPTTVAVATPLHKTPIFVRAASTEPRLDLNALYQQSLDQVQTAPTLSDGSDLVLPSTEE